MAAPGIQAAAPPITGGTLPEEPIPTETEIDRLRREVDQLRRENEELRKQLDDARADGRETLDQRDEARREVDQLRELVADLQSDDDPTIRLQRNLDLAREDARTARAEAKQLAEQLKASEEARDQYARASKRSTAPFRRRAKQKVPPGQAKRPGRKPGHKGERRPDPGRVDHHLEAPLVDCPACGGPVEDVEPIVQYIEEIPPIQPEVTKITTYRGTCPCCGTCRSSHPEQISAAEGGARVALGPRALSLAVMLSVQIGLTMRKTCAVLLRSFGLKLSPGGLSQILSRVAGRLSEDRDDLVTTVQISSACYVDETSTYVAGPGHWLWVFTTDEATIYRIAATRSHAEVRAVLGEEYLGRLTTDCFQCYNDSLLPYPYKHKCIAHHLKEIELAKERGDTTDFAFLESCLKLFQAVIELARRREADEISDRAYKRKRSGLERSLTELLSSEVTQPGDLAVQARLKRQEAHILGCLYEPYCEPTNNRAERELRPAVIKRKLSCGHRSETGARAFEVLASLSSTTHRWGWSFAEYVEARLPRGMEVVTLIS